MRHNFGISTLVLIAALIGTGCSTFSGPAGRDLVIQYTTIKIVENASDPAATATRARAIIADTRTMLQSDAGLTLASLEAAVRAKIDWASMDTANKLLVSQLITGARTDLEANVGPIEGVFDSTRAARVLEILASIENAITLSGF